MTALIPLTLPDPERDHTSGSADGLIRLLEYGDYECPFCGEVQPIIKEIQQRLGDDLLFAFRNFPLTNIHPHAEHAAEAAEAAGAQGNFWGMHDILFENQRALEDENLAAYAAELGLDETRVIREVTSSVYAQRIREDFSRRAPLLKYFSESVARKHGKLTSRITRVHRDRVRLHTPRGFGPARALVVGQDIMHPPKISFVHRPLLQPRPRARHAVDMLVSGKFGKQRVNHLLGVIGSL